MIVSEHAKKQFNWLPWIMIDALAFLVILTQHKDTGALLWQRISDCHSGIPRCITGMVMY
jgi:hypothetical protein